MIIQKKVYGRIYKITNTVNGKVYIGQAIKSLEEVWNEHKSKIGRAHV